MCKISNYFKTSIFFVLLILSSCVTINAQSEMASMFLQEINSAKAIGMGGCVVNNIDELSPIYNPGAFGIHSLQKNYSFSFPHKNKLRSFPDITLNTFSICAGHNNNTGDFLEIPNSVEGFGLAYSLEKYIYHDEFRIFDSYSSANHLTFGIGLDYYARFGLGIAYKFLRSKVTNENNIPNPADAANCGAFDYGVLIEIPVVNILQSQKTLKSEGTNKINFEFTPSFAYVKSNIGKDFEYIDLVQADPLPKLERTGLALYVVANSGKANFLSGRICYQSQKDLVGSTHDKIKSEGYEIGFLGCFYLRRGESDSDTDGFIKTKGYGFSLRGITRWAEIQGVNFGDGIIRYLANHMDITYDYAKNKDFGQEYFKLNISI